MFDRVRLIFFIYPHLPQIERSLFSCATTFPVLISYFTFTNIEMTAVAETATNSRGNIVVGESAVPDARNIALIHY